MGNGSFTRAMRNNHEVVYKEHPAVGGVTLLTADFTAACVQLSKGILAGLPVAVVRAPCGLLVRARALKALECYARQCSPRIRAARCDCTQLRSLFPLLPGCRGGGGRTGVRGRGVGGVV